MRKKFAKRCRRKLLAAGCKIESVEFIREPGWARKDCGYCVRFEDTEGMHWSCAEHDMLAAYQLALWGIGLGKEPGDRRKYRRPYRNRKPGPDWEAICAEYTQEESASKEVTDNA